MTMRRIGRRNGFIIGTALGAIGAAIITAAVMLGQFWTYCIGMMFLGAASAFAQQYRFAAADAAEPAFRPRAISWVMAGGVVTGVIGPQLAIHAQPLDSVGAARGPFLALIGLFVPDRPGPVAARRAATSSDYCGSRAGRPLSAFLKQPKFLIALLAAISSYALMSLVMTATPLAMIEHHHSHADAQTGIQWHVIAMFGPSFFTGSLIARFGKPAIAATGLLLIAASATVALMGTGLWHFWVALVLLGVGWNFGFIASTAMVAERYRPEEAFRVQAMNEFVLFSFVALASFSSGGLLVASGWTLVPTSSSIRSSGSRCC